MIKINWLVTPFLLDIVNATSRKYFRTTWGYKNATTGIYTGVMGDLQSGLTEIGGSSVIITLDRLDEVDFIAATAETTMKFIFKAPPLSNVKNIFTLPFNLNVWYSSYATVLLLFSVLYLIVRWEWNHPWFKRKLSNIPDVLHPKFFDVAMAEVGFVTQQGSDREPKSFSGRIGTILTLLVFMFLYTSYSAKIVALLQSTDDSLKILEDLLTSRISLGVEDNVYEHHYFETADGTISKAIYEKKIAPKGQKPNFMSLEEGMRKVKVEFFGFHTESTSAYKVVSDTFQENEKCSLKEIEFVKVTVPWYPVKKNSTYREILKVGMYRIRETGIQRRVTNRLILKKPACHSEGSNFVSVGLLDCYGAFMIFGIGLVSSLIIFGLELIWNKYLCCKCKNLEKRIKVNLLQTRKVRMSQIDYKLTQEL